MAISTWDLSVLCLQHDLVDDSSMEPKNACVDDMDLDMLKTSIQATEVFHVSAKTGYQVKSSMKLLEKIVSIYRSFRTEWIVTACPSISNNLEFGR